MPTEHLLLGFADTTNIVQLASETMAKIGNAARKRLDAQATIPVLAIPKTSLVDYECTHRDNNRLKRRLKAARLPSPATMEDLDLSAQRRRQCVVHPRPQ